MTFSGIARMMITNILNKAGEGKGRNDREHAIATSLYQKIEIPEEEQEALATKGRDGEPKGLTAEALRNIPDLEVELDFNEQSKLEKVLTECNIKPMDHKLWYDAIMAQLDEAKKAPIEDQRVKDKRLAEFRRAGGK